MEGRDPFNFICNKLTTFNVNAGNNRLNSFTENQVTVPTTYDLAGNMLTQGSKNFVYNASGKLSSMNSPGGVYGVYRYDAFGRRIKKSYAYQVQSGMLTGSIISIYGARSELLADYQDETSGIGTTTTRTNYINDDNNLAIATVTYSSATGTETTKYLFRNHMNQVIDPYTYTSDSGRDTMYAKPFSTGGNVNHQYSDHVSIIKFIERNWNLQPLTGRSRDNLPNPKVAASNPYVPTNSPAIGDLFDAFDFSSAAAH